MKSNTVKRDQEKSSSKREVVLVGSPNVGKSALFYQLTGIYTTVSNYPGTTVEVTRGPLEIHGQSLILLDTPGLYSLRPLSEEERVTRRILLGPTLKGVIHVVDALRLKKMLPLTLELLETGLPLILVLNMMDEAERRGISMRRDLLEKELGVPVIETISTKGYGISKLREALIL